jgi:hypothetical protein
MDTLKGAFLRPAVILWMLAVPVTFILSIIETWRGNASVPVKLVLSVTLDAFLAGIWPFTWALWGVQAWLGQQTPLDLVFP